MSGLTMSQLDRTFAGQRLQAIRTRGRGTKNPFVFVKFYDQDIGLELRTTDGWKLVGSMINTVRYRPEILRVTGQRKGDVFTLVLEALGGYKVAEFTAQETEKFPTTMPFDVTASAL